MATPLTLHVEPGPDGTQRLVATGEIDLSNVEVFAKALGAAVADATERGSIVTVDLSAVKYLDSAAINTLFAEAGHVNCLKLIVHPFLMPVLTISGLGELIPVEPAEPS